MSVAVRKCRVTGVERHPDFPALAREYAAEAAIHGLPAPDEKIASYRLIEASGFFTCYGAFLDESLVGFIALLTPVIPHYGVALTVAESFFVAKAHRKSGAGLKLLRRAENHAREAGAPGLLVSAPFGGRLAEVLPHVGYRETNRVFFKELPHA
jgi:GNAT superfamily N-acetyltransferase